METKDALKEGLRNLPQDVKDAFLYTLLKIGGSNSLSELEALVNKEPCLGETFKPIQKWPRNALEYVQNYLQDYSDVLVAIDIINRSNLFKYVSKDSLRGYRENECFYRNESIELRCTGEELHRDEYTFFLELLNTAKFHFGEHFRIDAEEFLARCGYPCPTTGLKDYLADSLHRMARTEIRIYDLYNNTLKATYSLMVMAEFSKKSGKIYFELPRFLGELLLIPSDYPYVVLKRFHRNWVGSDRARFVYDLIFNQERKSKDLVKKYSLGWFADLFGCKLNNSTESLKFETSIEFALTELMQLGVIDCVWVSPGVPNVDGSFYIAFKEAEIKKTRPSHGWKKLYLNSERKVFTNPDADVPVLDDEEV